MASLHFTKGHGTGNDFVLFADPDGEVELTAAQVAAICDRHFGVGADGILRAVRSTNIPEGAGPPQIILAVGPVMHLDHLLMRGLDRDVRRDFDRGPEPSQRLRLHRRIQNQRRNVVGGADIFSAFQSDSPYRWP